MSADDLELACITVAEHTSDKQRLATGLDCMLVDTIAKALPELQKRTTNNKILYAVYELGRKQGKWEAENGPRL
jgi:hypothetical protein